MSQPPSAAAGPDQPETPAQPTDQPQPAQEYAPGQQYPTQQYPPQQYGAYPAPARPTNTMAIVSLIAGIAGLTVVPLIGSIVAVITAPMARREMATSGEEGGSMATAGLVTGWVGIAIYGIAIVGFLAFWLILVAGIGASTGFS